MVDEELKKYHPEAFEAVSTPLLKPAPGIPDYLLKAKEYLKENPTAIRDVAPEFVDKINSALDNAPMGMGGIAKTYIYSKFPEAKAILNSEEGTKDGSGQEISSQLEDEPYDQPSPQPKPSAKLWGEIIEYMAELDEQGYTPGKISDAVQEDYGIDLHPVAVSKYLDGYYQRVPGPGTSYESEPPASAQSPSPKSMKVYQQLIDKRKEAEGENKALRAELELLHAQVDGTAAWLRLVGVSALSGIIGFGLGKII